MTRRFLFALLALLSLGAARAHDVAQIPATLTLQEDRWSARILLDSVFVADNLQREIVPEQSDLAWIRSMTPAQHAAMREAAEGFLRECFQIAIGNGDALPMEVRFPDFQKSPLTFAVDPTGTPMLDILLSGTLPPEEGALSIRWYAEDGPDLAISLEMGDGNPTAEPLIIPTGQTVDLARKTPDDNTVESHPSSFRTWLRYGFEHILPKGLDHILFILGLFLLAPKWKPLLSQSLAFTLAHSITLALVVLGVFSAPAHIVEPLIAASIAYVGIENLFLNKLKPWRLVLVFALGLLHGMGFAGVMQELPVPKDQIIEPLLGFNLGVELGQLAVLALAFAATCWAISSEKRFTPIRAIGSALIAFTGAYWTVDRILAGW